MLSIKNLLFAIKPFIQTYKWLLLLFVFFLLFIFLLFTQVFFPSNQPGIQSNISPTQPANITPTPNEQIQYNAALQNEADPNMEDSRPDLQNKEVDANGSTHYTFTSSIPNRPNITILTKDHSLIFSRTLTSDDLPIIPPSLIKEEFGEPDRIINGSTFYGSNSSIYIYASTGVAFIVDEQANTTFEEQRFTPMSAEEYLQKFGN